MDTQAFLAGPAEALRFALLQAVGPDFAGCLEILDGDTVQVGSRFEPLPRPALDAQGHAADEQDRGGHDQQADQEPVAAIVRETDPDDVTQGEDQCQRLDDQIIGDIDQHQTDRVGVRDQPRHQVADGMPAEEAQVHLLQLPEDVTPDGFDDTQTREIQQVGREELAEPADQHDHREEGDREEHLIPFRKMQDGAPAELLRPRKQRRRAGGFVAEDRRKHLAHQEGQAEGVGGREDDGRQQGQGQQRTASLQVGQVKLVTASEHAPSVANGGRGGNTKPRLFLLREGDGERDGQGQGETDDRQRQLGGDMYASVIDETRRHP